MQEQWSAKRGVGTGTRTRFRRCRLARLPLTPHPCPPARSGYQDNRYWTMWKLPMFGCTDGAQVGAWGDGPPPP